MKEKLHILQVNKAYYPHIGGIETLVETFSGEFSKRADAEVEVLVCTEKGKSHHETIDGVSVEYAASFGTYFSCPLSFDFLKKFRKLSRWADVIEIHTPFPLGDLACLLSGFRGIVVVAWHSDVVRQKTLLRFYGPLLRWLLRRADAVIVATPGHIESSAFLPAFREKCHVIPYGIDVDAYLAVPRKPILQAKLSAPENVRFLFVGRFVYYKGIDVLLDAFAKTAGSELFLVGTGTPEEMAHLTEKISASGITKRVHFLGNLSTPDLRAAFSDCDIFVLPSIANSEAFGIVQLEAMVYGKPVINTNLPTGVPYVSVDGESGITVPPEDIEALAAAMQRLTDDPALREKYGAAAARRVAEHFQEKDMISETFALMETLVDAKPKSRKGGN